MRQAMPLPSSFFAPSNTQLLCGHVSVTFGVRDFLWLRTMVVLGIVVCVTLSLIPRAWPLGSFWALQLVPTPHLRLSAASQPLLCYLPPKPLFPRRSSHVLCDAHGSWGCLVFVSCCLSPSFKCTHTLYTLRCSRPILPLPRSPKHTNTPPRRSKRVAKLALFQSVQKTASLYTQVSPFPTTTTATRRAIKTRP